MPNTLITRDVINKNIKYTGCYGNNDSDKLYDYDDLCREIDRFKNILLHNNAQKGQTVYNFLRGTRSTSLFFAAAELGLITCITDVTKSSRKLFFENDEYIDAKTRSVMPIDFVFEDKEVGKSEKRKMYCDVADKVIVYDKDFDCSYNNIINATDDTVIAKTCSSGTTGTPKSISHTHSFICKLAKRNSKSFYGNVLSTNIFHHGSSFATFFLPSLLADQVEFIRYDYMKEYDMKDIDHVQFPYTNYIKRFLRQSTSDTPQLNIYTLAKIDKSWKKYLGVKMKDIISLFGSSETSGPIFTQNLTDDSFEVDRFVDPDGWYDPKVIDGKLNLTGDRFEYNDDGSYKFLGRDDVVTIGGQDISLLTINQQAKELIGDCHVTLDTKFQKVYLCVWNDEDDLSKQIEKFTSLYTLDIETKIFPRNGEFIFLCGIKIDNESIRDHFRWLT
tara:strand:+ start:5213 stop:6547 length:1335 start_codon:yes stop_codon:yes gene_type:complete